MSGQHFFTPQQHLRLVLLRIRDQAMTKPSQPALPPMILRRPEDAYYVFSQTGPGMMVQGLVEELPRPGSVWPVERREAWLHLARCMFSLIYEAEEVSS